MKKPMKKKNRHSQTHTLQGLLPIPKKNPVLNLKFIIDRPLFLITIYYRTYSRYPTLLQALLESSNMNFSPQTLSVTSRNCLEDFFTAIGL